MIEKYTVAVTDTSTGETRSYVDPDAWGREIDRYMWEDGNWACDCVRARSFAEAAGEPNPELKCGCERFTVVISDAAGKVVYRDYEHDDLNTEKPDPTEMEPGS